jgi:hypothetical protein
VVVLLGLAVLGGVLYAVLGAPPAEKTASAQPSPLDAAIAASTNSSESAPLEPDAPREYRLRVYHKHQFGDCDGVLSFSAQRIHYATSHTEDAFTFTRKQLRLDDDGFVDPSGRAWHFSSPYGDVREVMRKWLGETSSATALTGEPPVDAAQPDPAPAPRTLAVKHKHRFGSCDGTLKLSSSAITFEAEDGKDSFTRGIDQVELDGDGIKDRGGKSWHFKSGGADLEEVLRKWKRP